MSRRTRHIIIETICEVVQPTSDLLAEPASSLSHPELFVQGGASFAQLLSDDVAGSAPSRSRRGTGRSGSVLGAPSQPAVSPSLRAGGDARPMGAADRFAAQPSAWLQSSVYIVSSLCRRNDTQIIQLQTPSGALVYHGLWGVDRFHSEDEALEALHARIRAQRCIIKSRTQADALVGYIVLGHTGLLCFARHTAPVASVFDQHTVYAVMAADWIRLALPMSSAEIGGDASALPTSNKRAEQAAIRQFTEYPIDGLHVYSETMDITRPFPSEFSSATPDADFCWNARLLAAFVRLGLGAWCVPLVQGHAVTRAIAGVDLCLTFITRRSCANPAMRSFARGLSPCSTPPNECETDVIGWLTHRKLVVDDDSGDNDAADDEDDSEVELIRWAAHLFRRGTPPISWQIQKSGGQAGSIIDQPVLVPLTMSESPASYFQLLRSRFGCAERLYVVDLLRADGDSPEARLVQPLEHVIKQVQRSAHMHLERLAVDLSDAVRTHGVDKALGLFWERLAPSSGDVAAQLTVGELCVARSQRRRCAYSALPMNGHVQALPGAAAQGHLVVHAKQTSFNRYTCYDATERSAVASLLFLVPVVAHMLLRLQSTGDVAWPPPSSSSSSSLLGHVPPFDRATNQALLECLVDVSAQTCDVLSQLYMSSSSVKYAGSLMSEVRAALVGAAAPSSPPPTPTPTHGLVGGASSSDERSRHVQSEMWVARNWLQHMPPTIASSLLSTEQLSFLSAFPATLLATLPSATDVTRPDCLLHATGSEAEAVLVSHVCPLPSGPGAVELHVAINRPAHVTTVGLVIKTDTLSPLAVDLYVGETLDSTRLVLEDVRLPQCPSGTHLYFELDDADPWSSDGDGGGGDSPYSLALAQYAYDYRCLRRKRSYPPLSRVLRLVFRGAGPYLVLGAVEIYGVTAFPSHSPDAARLKVRSAELSKHLADVVPSLSSSLSSSLSFSSSPSSSKSTTEWKRTEPVRRTGGEHEQLLSEAQRTIALQSAPASAWLAAVSEAPAAAGHEEYLARAGEVLRCDYVTFDQCLQLEHLRVARGVSERERDLLLARTGRDGASFLLDPNRFFYAPPFPSPAARRLMQKKSTTCQNHECGASIGFFSQPSQCMYCALWLCESCMHSERLLIVEFIKVESEPAAVCAQCAARIEFQCQVLRQLRQASLVQRSDYEELAYGDWKTLYAAQQMCSPPDGGTSGDERPTLVSSYPSSAVLFRVPTAQQSPPIESVFFDPALDVCPFYWQAPAGVSLVHVLLLLSYPAAVHRVSLLVDRAGYTADDAPSISFAFGHSIDDLVAGGTWELPPSQPGATLTWTPPAAPVSCRLVSVYIGLRQSGSAAASLHVGRLKFVGRYAPPLAQPPLMESSPAYRQAVQSTPPRPITPVRAQPAASSLSASLSSAVVELAFSRTHIHAFGLTFVRPNERTCWLHVLGYYTPESTESASFLDFLKPNKASPSKGVSLGRYLLPKTIAPYVQLIYPLKNTPAPLDSVVFQFDSPAATYQLPKVTLIG